MSASAANLARSAFDTYLGLFDLCNFAFASFFLASNVVLIFFFLFNVVSLSYWCLSSSQANQQLIISDLATFPYVD